MRTAGFKKIMDLLREFPPSTVVRFTLYKPALNEPVRCGLHSMEFLKNGAVGLRVFKEHDPHRPMLTVQELHQLEALVIPHVGGQDLPAYAVLGDDRYILGIVEADEVEGAAIVSGLLVDLNDPTPLATLGRLAAGRGSPQPNEDLPPEIKKHYVCVPPEEEEF